MTVRDELMVENHRKAHQLESRIGTERNVCVDGSYSEYILGSGKGLRTHMC